MEEQNLWDRGGPLPGEVVEYYYQPDAREVVETYVRPLPGRSAKPARSRRKRKKTGLWIFLICFTVTLGIAGAAYALNQLYAEQERSQFYYYPEEPTSTSEEEITIPTYPTGQGVTLTVVEEHGAQLSVQEIYALVNPSVVTVMATLKDGVSVGTGVIFREDGYILTNYHVLQGGYECTVALSNNRSYEAQYVAGDAKNDLAVVKVDLQGLPAAEFGDSDLLTVGDPVYAIGNPLGTELRGTLTDGIVSAINRDVQVEGRTMTLIQTNAALNSGNSGGPLINVYGQVVGINTIKMSSSYSNIEGLGFAIPSSSVEYLVNDLLTYGKVRPEPVLGVSVSMLGVEVEDGVWGIQVLDVTPGSAANLAGVEVDDFIISAGGSDISSSQDLMRVRQRYHVGEELPMTLWRDGEYREVSLTLDQVAE